MSLPGSQEKGICPLSPLSPWFPSSSSRQRPAVTWPSTGSYVPSVLLRCPHSRPARPCLLPFYRRGNRGSATFPPGLADSGGHGPGQHSVPSLISPVRPPGLFLGGASHSSRPWHRGLGSHARQCSGREAERWQPSSLSRCSRGAGSAATARQAQRHQHSAGGTRPREAHRDARLTGTPGGGRSPGLRAKGWVDAGEGSRGGAPDTGQRAGVPGPPGEVGDSDRE